MLERFRKNKSERAPTSRELGSQAPATTRGVDYILKTLNLSESDLAHKAILDLGPGENHSLIKYIGHFVDSSAAVGYGIALPETEETPALPYGLRKGYFQDIEFPPESFDLIVSTYGFPYYVSDESEQKSILQKLYTALKPGGEIRLSPIHKFYKNEILDKDFLLQACPGAEIVVEENLASKKQKEAKRKDPFSRIRVKTFVETIRGADEVLIIKKKIDSDSSPHYTD